MTLHSALRGLVLAPLALSSGATGARSAQVAPVPPPLEQQTADCAAPVFATDQLVCSNPTLRALDAELATRLAGAPEVQSRWIEPQRQWFLRRSRCAFAEDHMACVEAAYRERLALVRPQGPGTKMLKSKCSDPDIGTIAVEGDQIILIDRKGSIAGVAGSNDANNTWRPFLSAAWRGDQVIILIKEVTALNCRI
jgi:uncharacterized protein